MKTALGQTWGTVLLSIRHWHFTVGSVEDRQKGDESVTKEKTLVFEIDEVYALVYMNKKYPRQQCTEQSKIRQSHHNFYTMQGLNHMFKSK